MTFDKREGARDQIGMSAARWASMKRVQHFCRDVHSQRAEPAVSPQGWRSGLGLGCPSPFLDCLLLLAFLLLGAAGEAGATTFYIDCANGLDSNNGTNKATAWQHHPYMSTWTGSYTHAAGDRFIFKGGVTWGPTNFAMALQRSGVVGNSDYYGVDKTWYSGGAWSSPVFDAQSQIMTNIENAFILMNGQRNDTGNVIIDGIEFKGWYWDASHQSCYGILIGQSRDNVTIANCYFHDWTHGTYASGTRDGGVQLIYGATYLPGTNNVVTNCVFTGYPNGTESGCAVYSNPNIIKNCVATNLSNGFIIGSDRGGNLPSVTGCVVGDINFSFDPGSHENAIEFLSCGGTIAFCRIYDSVAVTVFVGGNPGTNWICNNVFYSAASRAIQVDGDAQHTNSAAESQEYVYILNNTFQSTGYDVLSASGNQVPGHYGYVNTYLLQNNHFILDGGANAVAAAGYNTMISNHNLTNTTAVANTAGYTLANLWRPTSATSPTVDQGVSQASTFGTDILGTTRPQGSAWDIGAYEYMAGGASLTVSPASQGVGPVLVGTTNIVSFVLSNAGTQTVSGAATVALPFQVLSGGTYSLAAKQSQTVTLAYTPTSAGSTSQVVAFSGGGGTSATVIGTATTPVAPQVSAIVQTAAYVDTNAPALAVYSGSTAQYSGSATDPNGLPLNWQWLYTLNGGPEILVQSGTGSVSSVTYGYGIPTIGNSYIWKLRVSNGYAMSESDLAVEVEAAPVTNSAAVFSAASGTVTPPFTVAEGSVSQAVETGVSSAGSAVYSFTIANAGSYVVQALVNAPGDAANSFFVNIDGLPQDPTMVWDIPVTSGFEQRIVGWRGNGTYLNNQFVPKVFSLGAGTHQLYILGREANTQVQSIAIWPLMLAPANPANLHIVAGR